MSEENIPLWNDLYRSDKSFTPIEELIFEFETPQNREKFREVVQKIANEKFQLENEVAELKAKNRELELESIRNGVCENCGGGI